MRYEDAYAVVKRAKQGNHIALQNIIEACSPMIYSQINQIYIMGYEKEDLFQIGCISVMNAVEKYKLDSGVNFFCYAKTAIRQNYTALFRKAEKIKYELSINNINKQGIEYIEIIESDINIQEDYLYSKQRTHLREALKSLNEEEFRIVNWYYLSKKSLTDYCRLYNVGYEKAKREKKNALDKLYFIMEHFK